MGVLGVINRAENIAPTEDLAFSMYQDADTATMVKQLVQMKEAAVASQNYVRAAQLKSMVATLQLVSCQSHPIPHSSNSIAVHARTT
jgi:hypothetical protein